MRNAYILAIDTSCDDTSAAVTCGTTVLSNVVASQTELHKPYGGVFPTVAKLAHAENIDRTIQVALARAGTSIMKIDAVAVTVGPGLAPALEVGINTAKELALSYKKPLIAVNHIEGHVVSVLAQAQKRTIPVQKRAGFTERFDKVSSPDPVATYPALAVIVSGGHTQFVLVTAVGQYKVLGATLDDAAGECLDKIGRMLNLGYPAGPIIEEFAKQGDRNAVSFPLPLTTTKTYDLSFSGMKTFARNLLERKTAHRPLSKEEIYDFCASAQYGVFKHICYKLEKLLIDQYTASLVHPNSQTEIAIREVWLGGGVAANMTLRKMLRGIVSKHNAWVSKKNLEAAQQISAFRVPYSKKLCADNAAMIGIAAASYFEKSVFSELEKLQRVPQLRIA